MNVFPTGETPAPTTCFHVLGIIQVYADGECDGEQDDSDDEERNGSGSSRRGDERLEIAPRHEGVREHQLGGGKDGEAGKQQDTCRPQENDHRADGAQDGADLCEIAVIHQVPGSSTLTVARSV